jgi:hypothetical protein
MAYLPLPKGFGQGVAVMHTFQNHSRLDLGKEKILEEFIEQMMGCGVDLKTLALTWQRDLVDKSWILTARKGKDHYALKFTEREVTGWPDDPQIASRHSIGMRRTLEKLREPEAVALVAF